jgi:RNA polymerase sigma-70 factor (ECF subfamily)
MDTSRRDRLRRELTRLAEGDRSAFDPVYDAVWPLVRRFAARALQNQADAEDCAQRVLLRVFARASEFDRSRDALAWILGIAAWEVRTLRKARARRREAGEAEDKRVDVALEASIVRRDLEEALHAVIEEMKLEDRETLLLAIHESERPSIPAATFRKRLQRAIERLKAAWRVKHGTE